MSLGNNGRKTDIVVTSVNCNGMLMIDQQCNVTTNDLTIMGNVVLAGGNGGFSGLINAFGIGRIYFNNFYSFVMTGEDTQFLDSSFWTQNFETTPGMLLAGPSIFTMPTAAPGIAGTNWTALVQVDVALSCLIGDDTTSFMDSVNIALVQNLLKTTIAPASNGVVLPVGNIYVESTTGFSPSGGSLFVNTGYDPSETQTVDYTYTQGNVFAGCSGGNGELLTGAVVANGDYNVISNVLFSTADAQADPEYNGAVNTFFFSDIVQLNPGDTLDIAIFLNVPSDSGYLVCLGGNYTYCTFKILTIIPNPPV